MKKRILALILIMASLVACSNKKDINNDDTRAKINTKEVTDKKTITVTTTFIADMVNELIGDKADIELIIPAGEDPHLYVAKPEDLKKLKDADLVLYHGLHFEGKMVDALEAVGYPITETFDKKDIGQMDEDGETIVDPHFWFDIDLYKEAFTNTANKLKELYKNDEKMQDLIDTNCKKYLAKLDDLNTYVVDRLNELPEDKRYLITPHDAFNYFSRKYDISVMAPQGVSTDSELSNKDLEDTASFIADKKIKAIFAESTTNPERMQKLADIVKSKGFETKVVGGEGQELYSDSLSAKSGEADTYIKMYKHNIDLMVDNLK
ncbi:MAG: zinc ABC transporter substrate-binding protein [Anaerococcus sp.]|jgi:zn2+ ABC superfamily ATP binding cassette transporter, binding protein|uniref:metal ABC transporter solute-binding protein, Zn/Mn family n=1 Tax=Anaerococcus sp. TaxID=1872515 RepID=UPI0029038F03|nr:zinc ABC transporter substrate-binding protein [Anaerococcus sp.]MDU1828126.1 zinc ABC transporter substrate-binding protein [Anaerococcus sp.]MDU1864331.1 zinc ABC transporter substrate-binding protein [Anaerococcus sp.]MDU2354155.1 zinc ABC transporter substrate-binding protein [Anaerococcus sp.]